MPMKLLIGYDDSKCAKAAIADLVHAGLPDDVEASVLTVADVWPQPQHGAPIAGRSSALAAAAEASRSLAAQALEEAAALADVGAASVRALFPHWRVTAGTCADSPYWGLIKHAEQAGADLLLVGSQGRSAIGRFILGSVSQTAVNNATCSVRVGRNHSSLSRRDPGAAVRILIGVDGSSDSMAAVRAVAQRKWPAGSEVTVEAVTDLRLLTALPQPFPATDAWIGESHGDGRAWARRAVDRAADVLRDAGLETLAVVHEGDPRKVLVQDAERWGADCIFVGARGLTRVERLLIGSVSSGVATRAHCSVEIVRPA